MLYHRETFAEIKNFILIKYDKTAGDDLQSGVDYNYHRLVQERLFDFMVDQLQRIYPRSYIHVITDKPIARGKMLISHCLSFPHNYLNKFLVWDLLDEPSMYLDTDIILHYPFLRHHIITENSFNLYNYFDQNIQEGSRIPFVRPVLKHYNCGIIWIAKPSKGFSDVLLKIHEKYFSDDEYLVANGMMPNQDEHAVSFYVETTELEMKLFPEVNHKGWNKGLLFVQSSHFPGRRLKKQLMEYLGYEVSNHGF
jgi:hypothetical protein